MGKTYRRNQALKPRGKDFKFFKKSKKFKKWNEKPHHTLLPLEVNKDLVEESPE